MKVCLVFPPWADPTQPYGSLPTLYAYLRRCGIETWQLDLNIETYHYFLSKQRLGRSLAKANRQLAELLHKNKLSSELLQKIYKLQIASLIGPYVVSNIEKAKRDLRDNRCFYDFPKYIQANYIIQKALELLSLEFLPSEISPYLFSMDASLEKVDEIKAAISNSKENPCLEFYQGKPLRDILQYNPDLIGISITYSNQLIPGLTLAKLIKDASPLARVVVGGGFITRIADDIKKTPSVFDIIDMAIVYEGERPLLELVRALDHKTELDSVPNLIFRKGNQVCSTSIAAAIPLSTLPTPLYDGLPLEQYLCPEPVLLIMESKGCYWNRCAFCDIPKNSTKLFQLKDVRKVVDDIEFYRNRYGATKFFFSTDSLVPKFVAQFCDEIIERGLNIRWQGELRFEKSFTDELLEKMAEAGCRSLIFGFESGNQRVLDLMDKGTELSNTARILRTCARHGIGVNLQSFIGFPTESREEAWDTVRFLLDNEPFIGSISFGYFQLEKLTDVFERPEIYDLEPTPDPNADFHLYYPYKVRCGLTQLEVMDLYKVLKEVLQRVFYLDGETFGTNGITAHSLLHFAHDYNKTMQHWKKDSPRATPILDEEYEVFTKHKNLVVRRSPLDLHRIATFVEGKRTIRSQSKLTHSNEILIFNKASRRITQFTNQPLLMQILNRLGKGRTLSQFHHEICQALDIPLDDRSFFNDLRRFLTNLYAEEIVVSKRKRISKHDLGVTQLAQDN